jgi:signal peptidase II
MGSTPILGTPFSMIMKKYRQYLILVLIIIIIDQSSKLIVYFYLSDSDRVISILGKFLELHYVLNEGMAFGITLGIKYGKLLLTFSRIFLSYLIINHIKNLIINNEPKPIIISWCLIIAGAIGNSIDGIFYGFLLNNASPSAPIKLFYGKVIDMIAIDTSFFYKLINFLPWVKNFSVIPRYPVFNVADVSITVGVLMLIFLDFLSKRSSRVLKSKS